MWATSMKIIIILVTIFLQTVFSFASANKKEMRPVAPAQLNEARVCYADELKKDPKLKGKLMIVWDVNDKGEVTKAEVSKAKSTLNNAAVETCLIQKLKSWKFPAAPTGETAEITYPFVFKNK